MANKALLGFVKGATGYALDNMKAQQEDQRALRKAALLEQLRKDTEKEMIEFREALKAKDVDPQLSQNDYTSGKRILRNNRGEEIGRLDLTASELESYNMAKQDKELDSTYKQKQIENFDADNRRADQQLDLQRQQLGLSRERLSLDRDSAKRASAVEQGTADSLSVGQEIVYKNSKVADDLIRAGVPAEIVMQTAAQAAAQAKARGGNFSTAQNYFLRAATILRERAKKEAENE